MPNRILREGILTSDRVDLLSDLAELFYRRFMSVVDDYGRFDGRLVVIRGACFPLRIDRVTERDICEWIDECEKVQLLERYIVAGKPYIQMLDFRQQVRSSGKYPEKPLHSNCLADAKQLHTLDGVGVGVVRERESREGKPFETFDGMPEQDDRWQIDQAKDMARKAGYEPEEIACAIKDVRSNGTHIDRLGPYLLKVLKSNREKIAKGKAPPIQPSRPLNLVPITDERRKIEEAMRRDE